MSYQYRKKPVVIEALQWTGTNLREVIAFTDGRAPDSKSDFAGMMWERYEDLVKADGLKIFTLEGKMLANIGDWIIRGVKNEFYPCKPDIFAATYDPAATPPQPAPQPGDLHDAIMRLPFNMPTQLTAGEETFYRHGHFNALRAAAELVAASVQQDRQDAERYRILRDSGDFNASVTGRGWAMTTNRTATDEEMAAAVDALAARKEPKP